MISFEPLDPAHISDPYPTYQLLRSEQPSFWHEGLNSWVVSRYDDCEKVLRSTQAFARDWRRVGQSVDSDRISIQNLDPPDHTPLHTIFLAAVRAQDIDRLCRQTATRVHRRAVDAAAGDAIEVMSQFAVPFGLELMAEFLGVRMPTLDEFAETSEAVMRAMDGGLRPDAARAGEQARRALTTLVDGWFQDTGNLTGALGHVRKALQASGAVPIDPRFVRNTARVMFQGGYRTLVAAIGNLLHVIAGRPDVQRELQEMNSAELGRAIDEISRFDGPVQGTTRAAMADGEIEGSPIQAGQNVLCLLGSANRDEDRFERADRLILDRSQNRHMAYGWGAHACIASILARSALVETARAFLADQREIRIAGRPRRRDTATLRAWDHLPVRSIVRA
jgi:cytochrome P450